MIEKLIRLVPDENTRAVLIFVALGICGLAAVEAITLASNLLKHAFK